MRQQEYLVHAGKTELNILSIESDGQPPYSSCQIAGTWQMYNYISCYTAVVDAGGGGGEGGGEVQVHPSPQTKFAFKFSEQQ